MSLVKFQLESAYISGYSSTWTPISFTTTLLTLIDENRFGYATSSDFGTNEYIIKISDDFLCEKISTIEIYGWCNAYTPVSWYSEDYSVFNIFSSFDNLHWKFEQTFVSPEIHHKKFCQFGIRMELAVPISTRYIRIHTSWYIRFNTTNSTSRIGEVELYGYIENVLLTSGDDYRERGNITISEISGIDKEDVAFSINLNDSNFNFNTFLSNGKDFRLCEKSNGITPLDMWLANFDINNNRATYYFKLPKLMANEVKTLWVFWGKVNDIGVSDFTTFSGSFLFFDDFDGNQLDYTKWGVYNNDYNSTYYQVEDSRLTIYAGPYFIYPKIYPLSNIRNWIIEQSSVGIGMLTPTSYDDYYLFKYLFYGGENEVEFRCHFENSIVNRKHNFISGGSLTSYNTVNRGIEPYSYSFFYIAYLERYDKFYQGIKYQNSISDYEDNWDRVVHRNTELNYFKLYGPKNGSVQGIAIDWIIVREYDPDNEPIIDLSGLDLTYEHIGHQAIDNDGDYLSDCTSVDYFHYSSFGGDPYRLSDNISNSIFNIFSSNNVVDGYIIIDFGREKNNLVNSLYLHLDNNHEKFYGAVKLSDNDDDIHNRNYWKCTTSSGVWAAIEFPSQQMVGCLSVTARASDLTSMIKNFKFYGCYDDPRYVDFSSIDLLCEGIFQDIADEQTFYFTTGGRKFKYYILEALNSYGSNIMLQEWGMYELTTNICKKVISQIRLNPASFDGYESYFPKNIAFYGSNDNVNWDLLLLPTQTYTPFYDATYGRWQRFSFINYTPYYCYKLYCEGNWYGTTNVIKMADWEMVEKFYENDSYRILIFDSNDINNVWAYPGATFDSGNLYVSNENINIIDLNDNKVNREITISGTIFDINVR